jgi:hypothetical protein
MCNVEHAKKNKIPVIAVCACGAFFFHCEDDNKEAREHITHNSSPNHYWTYFAQGFNFPNPPRNY